MGMAFPDVSQKDKDQVIWLCCRSETLQVVPIRQVCEFALDNEVVIYYDI